MSLFTRILNVFRKERLQREIDEELADHIRHAMADGRTREEAERALGSLLRHRESTVDVSLASWLDGLRADTVFGLRQFRRRKAATAAAVLSLALAIGSVTSAFRLIDAALFRPLPVKDPHSLWVAGYIFVDRQTGVSDMSHSFSYPMFRKFRDALRDKADVMALSGSRKYDITFAGDDAIEKAYSQYVSGAHFGVLGVKPVLGRLIGPEDDLSPGGHPVAVLSDDYWESRFQRDPGVLGRSFRHGNTRYEIIGVAQRGYTGTEPGKVTAYFIPTMQSAEAIDRGGWNWIRIWVRPKPGVSIEQIRQPLQAVQAEERRQMSLSWKASVTQQEVDEYVQAPLVLVSASAGNSYTQKQYRQPLFVLAGVAVLVLLIACANVANLLTAQAGARAKEMALRVSIGAGRGRLMQLILMECLMLAAAASVLGMLFAWWATPVVVGMINPPDDPVRLMMPADWRVIVFSALLPLCVTLLFGLVPALRASSVKPASALKGGDDPHSRRRLMNAMIAAQVAFCFVVHFGAGLFVATLERVSRQSPGFGVDRVLLLETWVKDSRAGGGSQRGSLTSWNEILDRVRETQGVEAAGVSNWALMSGSDSSSTLRVGKQRPDGSASPFLLGVSPGWIDAMRIGWLGGRDFRPGERGTHRDAAGNVVSGVAIVSEEFARLYYGGENPVGKSFETYMRDRWVPHTIVGYVRDVRYRALREPIRATWYHPFEGGGGGTFAVRTDGEPLGLGPALRPKVSATRPDFLVSTVRTQEELVRNQTIRERLLATLSSFFAVVALILAGVGLCGVMHYAVVQRRREIGIRLALGANAMHVARQVTGDVGLMLALGSALGLGAGLLGEQYVRVLLFGVQATDGQMIGIPLLTLLVATTLAAVPPVVNALRIDPVTSLKSEG